MTHSNKEILKLWLEDLDKLAYECSKAGHMITSGEVNKFIVGMNEIVKALVEESSLFKENNDFARA